MGNPTTLQHKRRLRILEIVRSKNVSNIEELTDICRREKLASDPRTIDKDLQELGRAFALSHVGAEVRWPSVDLGELLADTAVARRLNMLRDSKKRLAEWTVHRLRGFDPPPRRLLLCAGSTIYEIAKEIFGRAESLSIDYVYTNNLLVLCEAMMMHPPNINIELPQGQIERDSGIIWGRETLKWLQRARVDVLITTFGGLSLIEGFSSGNERDVEEKQANLCPHKECRRILIPICWDKIGIVEKIVATDKHLDKSGERDYTIITDPPKGDIDQEKRYELEDWASAQKVVTVIYAH